MSSRASLYKWLLALAMLCCFCAQVYDAFFKFIRQQTTLVSKRRELQSSKLPAINFCPGYKDHGKDYYDRSEELSSMLENEDEFRTPMEVWMNDTYSIDEVVMFMKGPGPDWYSLPEIHVNRTGFYPSINITVHEVSSAFGRCYAVHFHYVLQSKSDFFSLRFNLSQHEELFLYIHEDFNEVGQHWGYYPIQPIQAIVKRGSEYTITAQKNTFKPYDNAGCRTEEDYSYPLCVVNWARRRFGEIFAENNRTACWIPDTQYYALGSNLPGCQRESDANWVRATVYSEITHKLTDRKATGCARRCVQSKYDINFLREPDLSDGSTDQKDITNVYLQDSFMTDDDEEVVLYDLNNIVASLGGSLSLFLGVSVFSIIVYVGNRVGNVLKSRKKEESNDGKLTSGAGLMIFKRPVFVTP